MKIENYIFFRIFMYKHTYVDCSLYVNDGVYFGRYKYM